MKAQIIELVQKPDERNISVTDVGTEELAHLEIVGAMVHQLTRCLSIDDVKKGGFDAYYIDHTTGVYPASSAGMPWTAAYIQSKGDVLTDLHEDLAAEQKARTTYDNLLRICDDPDVCDVLRFLRAREVVHYQRFGEAILLFKVILFTQKRRRNGEFRRCCYCFYKNGFFMLKIR